MRTLIGLAAAAASIAWAEFGSADYGEAWLKASTAERTTFFSNYIHEIRLRNVPSPSDHPSIAQFKINQLDCLNDGKVDFAAVDKIMGQYYGYDRFKCVRPEIIGSMAVDSLCRDYIARDKTYMLPPMPAPCTAPSR